MHPIEQRELVQVVYPFEYDSEHEKLGNLLPDAFRLNGQQKHGVAETMAAQQIEAVPMIGKRGHKRQ